MEIQSFTLVSFLIHQVNGYRTRTHTHRENVSEIDTQREIKEQNVWQADLLQGVSLKKELCTPCTGRQVGREMRWAGRGGTGRRRMVVPCSTALPSCRQACQPGRTLPCLCTAHWVKNPLCLLYSMVLPIFLSWGTLRDVKLYISIKQDFLSEMKS